MSTLDTLGLKLSDPVTSLFQQLADRQPSEDNKAACARIGADLQNDWCCVNIACLKNPCLTSDDMIGVLESNGGKRTWLKSIQFIIGHSFPPTAGLGTGVPPSAALARSTGREMPTSELQLPPILSAQVDPLAATAMPMDRIMSVIKDTRGAASREMPACLSYTDTKLVMREVYVWQATQTGTVACSKSGADTLAQILYDHHLIPWGKKSWTRKILQRKKNGRRSNAKVGSPHPSPPLPAPPHYVPLTIAAGGVPRFESKRRRSRRGGQEPCETRFVSRRDGGCSREHLRAG